MKANDEYPCVHLSALMYSSKLRAIMMVLHMQIQRLSGVDSDFAPFLHHAGVPSVDLYYGKGTVLPSLAKPDQAQNYPNRGTSVLSFLVALCPINSVMIDSFCCRLSGISHSI